MAKVLQYSSGVRHCVPDELAAEALRRALEHDASATLVDAQAAEQHAPPVSPIEKKPKKAK